MWLQEVSSRLRTAKCIQHDIAKCNVICDELIHQFAASSRHHRVAILQCIWALIASKERIPRFSTWDGSSLVGPAQHVECMTDVTTMLLQLRKAFAVDLTAIRKKTCITFLGLIALYTDISWTLPTRSAGNDMLLPPFDTPFQASSGRRRGLQVLLAQRVVDIPLGLLGRVEDLAIVRRQRHTLPDPIHQVGVGDEIPAKDNDHVVVLVLFLDGRSPMRAPSNPLISVRRNPSRRCPGCGLRSGGGTQGPSA
jgi:hypothetical protein